MGFGWISPPESGFGYEGQGHDDSLGRLNRQNSFEAHKTMNVNDKGSQIKVIGSKVLTLFHCIYI